MKFDEILNDYQENLEKLVREMAQEKIGSDQQLDESLAGFGLFTAVAGGFVWYIYNKFKNNSAFNKVMQSELAEENRQFEAVRKKMDNIRNINDVADIERELTNVLERIETRLEELIAEYPENSNYTRTLKAFKRKISPEIRIELDQMKEVLRASNDIIRRELGDIDRRIQRWKRMNRAATDVNSIGQVEDEYDNIMTDINEAIDRMERTIENVQVRRIVKARLDDVADQVRADLDAMM